MIPPRIADPDNLGLVIEHASGVRPSHADSPLARSAATLVPAWNADTHDGYDIYAGNWPVDPALVPALPIGVHKASEGFGTFDAKFGEWVSHTAGRHRYRGAYHVIWPWRAGKADNYIEQQAESYLSFTRSQGVKWEDPGWFVQIDNEQFSGMPRIANVEEVRRFADYLIARIGPKISHYCNPVTDPTIFFAPELADIPKWEAQYNRNPSREPTMIRQWGGWPVAGIWNDRPVDANFIEKHDVLDELAGYGEQPPQPPTPTPGGIVMGQHLGYLQLTDDAGNVLANLYGELMMGFDSKLYSSSTAGEGIGVFGFPIGRASQSAYNALPAYNPDTDAVWLLGHISPQPAVNLTPVLTAIASVQSGVNSLATIVSNGFTSTNQNVGLVGASVAAARSQLDAITTTVNAIQAAINSGGGSGGNSDLTPVLAAIAALSKKLENLAVTVSLNGTGTTGTTK